MLLRLLTPRSPLLLAAVAAGLLSACSSTPSSLGSSLAPYKIEIVQGNVVTREQSQMLRAGMTRTQVAEILGTPLLASVFHGNRWDYVFTLQRQGQKVLQRRFTVFFDNDLVARFEGDELPSEIEFVASIDNRRKIDKSPALEATPEQLKSFRERNPQATPEADTAPAGAPAGATYPPLEAGATR